ncbi:glycoside hydrolase family 127 protein [Methylocapsa sp. S129]|uniref:glycoside hydrolase family 127 protein n=1 Tax=Methylocapsa sp. S129 TaxID=1641869 RepID=UPI00131CDD38|nr:beta-L-arabinofuranosidase domain-containing protein [Methylocapsa sp. S129]
MRRYTPVRFADVDFGQGFWHERLETVLTRTIPSQYEQLGSHGILESLKAPKPAPALRIPISNHGMSTQVFWDSDVGKWIEAASYALSHRRDAVIEARIEEITDWLAQTQLPDGYLNCWYIGREIDKRWTNLRDRHELYCAGHMIEGAVAYFQATGRRRLLDIFCRYVDHIAAVFGPGPGQKRGYCGHPEIELALIKLHHVTGDRAHLDLAAYFVDERGNQNPQYFDVEALARGDDPKKYWFSTHEYSQSHKPVREQDKAVGHAVRALYLYAAMADLASDLGDESLKKACESLWRDVTTKRMYVTAGVGPSASNEGFTRDYDLPNDTAYAETCASVALIFWAQRMLNIDCDGAYADILELALYNGALSGLSRDGVRYFYQNPLESDGAHTRWEWHPCPCCTMNVARLVASVGGYFYSTGEGALAVHLYGTNSAQMTVDGRRVGISQQADYPWSGKATIEVAPEEPAAFTLKLRIPGWARSHSIAVNGVPLANLTTSHGYAEVRREWRKGDSVELILPMPIEKFYANPNVRADVGRVGLRRGPLIYCVEEIDNPSTPVPLLRLPKTAQAGAEFRPELFDGVVAVVAEAEVVKDSADDSALYQAQPFPRESARLTAVPYYIWNNRGPNRMAVWLPET